MRNAFRRAHIVVPGTALIIFLTVEWVGHAAPAPGDPQREIAPGISTAQIIPGEPFDLAGRRIAFTNWHYVVPGDNFDWVNEKGESVYVKGDEGPFGARYVGNNTPWGIKLVVRKPHVLEPFERPHRGIVQAANGYLGWTDSDLWESADGMNWTKKAPLVFNNMESGVIYQAFEDPTAEPAERYKTIFTGEIDATEFKSYHEQRGDELNPRGFLHFSDNGKIAVLKGAVSPDGINWTGLAEPLVVDYCDTLNTAYYDSILHRYVLYTRFWSVNPFTTQLQVDINDGWTSVGRRAIGRSESSDFSRFPPAELVLEPNTLMAPSEELYTNCHTTIPGGPDQHLFFPAVWDVAKDTTSIWMASSFDGKVWNWAPEGPLLETGRFGDWNGGCIWALPEMIELPNGDWALPYLAHNFPHKYPRGQVRGAMSYAVWPKGRLMGIEAESKGGFGLVALMPPGRTLKINAETDRVGSIRVQVAGADGRDFGDCDPLVGDLPWTKVTWQGQDDLGTTQGQPVRLRFEMEMATIYGMEFE